MPFATCKICGRVFHTFDPTVREPAGGYWPNLARAEVHETCPECLKMTPNQQHDPDATDRSPKIVAGTEAHRAEPKPSDLEVAWQQWLRRIHQADDQQIERQRQAFEAGWRAAGGA